MISSAHLSECGTYRYALARKWAPGPTVGFIGVNPSTANATVDDATVRKWRGFARLWGFGGFRVTNLFAFRATNVSELARAADPVGPHNNQHLEAMLDSCDVIVPCWGDRSKMPRSLRGRRVADVRSLLRNCGKPVKVLGFTKNHDPKHPLMLGYATSLSDWSDV